MRPPYPVTLVPLLPQFLQRRNATLDFPLRATERYGIDRPAETDRYFFAPWPDDVGAEATWIESALARTNAALA